MKTLPLFAALAIAGSASAAQVWVAPAAQKVRPTMTVPASAPVSASIAAAQNEFESFQVVVSGAASNVSMAFSGLTDAAGDSIGGKDVVLYREAIINVTQQSGGDGAVGQWPDALIPDVDYIAGEKRNAFPFSVTDGQSIAVFVDVHAPQATPAGTYTGTVHVTGGVTVDVPVTLTVWDFAVPSTSTLKSAYGLAWNGPCMGHGDSGCSNYASDMALRARYVQAALDNHVSIHQPYYTSTINSSGAADWSAFDQYAGPFLDGTANTRLVGAKLTEVSVNGAQNATQDNGWAAHFAAKGWSSQLFGYECDEPPLTCAWTDITPRDNAANGANINAVVTTTAAQAKSNGAAGIDTLTPVINFVEGKPGSSYAGNQRSQYPATMWWYQSCMSYGCSGVSSSLDSSGETGWPTMAIDADATRNRAMEWLSFVYNVQGELYYETTQAYFSGDPWTNQYNFGGNGDGNLFYPGTPAKIGGSTEIPVESLRLKMVRDGMEDYELLAMAKSLGLGDQALQIAQGVYPKTYQATSTPAAIDSARAELAALILHALGKDVTSGSGSSTGSTGGSTGSTGGSTGSAGSTGGSSASPGAGTPSAGSGSTTGTTTGTTACTTTACGGDATSATGSTSSGASVTKASAGGGGCSSGGPQSLWLAIPFFGLFLMRKRKTQIV